MQLDETLRVNLVRRDGFKSAVLTNSPGGSGIDGFILMLRGNFEFWPEGIRYWEDGLGRFHFGRWECGRM
jgi:hypothetical protein